MRANIPFIKEKFDGFRQTIFNVELPDITIEVSNSLRQLGKLITYLNYPHEQPASRYKMIISNRYDLPESQLEDIIIHEMIHLVIDYHRIKDTAPHGKVFKSMMKTINQQFRRNIGISANLDDNMRETDSKPVHSFIFTFHIKSKGKDALMRCAKTFLFEAHKRLSASPDIEDLQLYVTSDPYFTRFTKTRTFKYYYVNSEVRRKLDSPTLLPLIIQNNTVTPRS